MDTTAAAAQAGVTVATIRTWCRIGAVKAAKVAGRWVIDAASLARRIQIGAMRRTQKETIVIDQKEQYPWDSDHPEREDLLRLVQAGVTPEQIVNALGVDAQGMGRYEPFTGKSRRWMEQQLTAIEVRAQEQTDAAQARARQHLATPRQVDYILTLLAARKRSGEGGGFFSGPTDRAGIAELSKGEASSYITSLKGDY